jgi:hypothetical protein
MASPPTLRVDPAALENIRGIGKVWAEVSIENERNGRSQIENLLVIDVGAASGREALDKAADLLEGRNWMIDTENRPAIVLMESANWKDAHLVLYPFHPAYFEDHPEVLGALEKASVKEESLVYLEVFEGVL